MKTSSLLILIKNDAFLASICVLIVEILNLKKWIFTQEGTCDIWEVIQY